MPSKNEYISLSAVSFDKQGPAVIDDQETVARLRAAISSEDAIKNIGCCSVAMQSSEGIRELGQLAKDVFRTAGPDVLEAIKNIGCCSSPAAEGVARLGVAAAAGGEEAIKNIGCCSASLGDAKLSSKQRAVLDEQAIKNIGCCSAALEEGQLARPGVAVEEAIKNIG